MPFPAGYEWLETVGVLPKCITNALALFGIHEGIGSVDNPTIMAWAEELELQHEYTADSVPWCGLFAGVVVHRSGYLPPDHPLWALNWQGFGLREYQPLLGDVLVFLREGGGHVGFYVGEDRGGPGARPAAYHVLGGNTGDAVAIARIDKHRLVGARVPPYHVRPPSAKPYILAATGGLSTNEA